MKLLSRQHLNGSEATEKVKQILIYSHFIRGKVFSGRFQLYYFNTTTQRSAAAAAAATPQGLVSTVKMCFQEMSVVEI